MRIDNYSDSIIGLLLGAGVSEDEIKAKGTEAKLSHAYMKGVDWDKAAKAILEDHDVTIK